MKSFEGSFRNLRGGTGGQNPGLKGAGSIPEAGEKRAGSVIFKVARYGSSTKKKQTCSLLSMFAWPVCSLCRVRANKFQASLFRSKFAEGTVVLIFSKLQT